MKYSIQSKYILYKDQLISGYVCIEGEYIKHILLEPNELLNQYPIKYVYENQVLMPAAIDTNVLQQSNIEICQKYMSNKK